MIGKRGIFFSIDALIAVIIILIIIIVNFPSEKHNIKQTEIHRDLITTLSSLKIEELNNSYAKQLIAQGLINSTNKSVLEQIGEFYVNNITIARSLADSILKELKINTNIGIWYNNILLASSNSTSYEYAKAVNVAKQTISGIQEGNPTTGFVSKAWLKKIKGKFTTLAIRGDLMCGKWKTYSWGDYCGPATTDITYEINIPENATIENAWWLVEPSWIGQPTKLKINNNTIYNSDIQYFIILNITPYLKSGKNFAFLDSTTGGDDGASHLVIEYTTPGTQTFTIPTKYYFNKINSKAILYHEKALFVPETIKTIEVVLNTSSQAELSIRTGTITIVIGTKNPVNNTIIFNDMEINNILALNNISYTDLNKKYFFFIVKIGQSGQTVSLNENSYIEIERLSEIEIPFGSIDITKEIKINETKNKLQDTFYNSLTWKFFLPLNSIPVIADWQLGWLSTSSQQASQLAKANGIILYESPPEPFIPAFSRFGYTPQTANNLFNVGENNFTLNFSSSYGVSNTTSFGTVTYFIKSFVNYGDAKEKAQGGIKTLTFEDDSTKQISVGNNNDTWDPDKDAIDDAVERLLAQLDANNDTKIDISLDQDDLKIDILDISGVPYLWSTEVQIRTWY